MARARRLVIYVAASLAVLYLALCILARVMYPRVLFPAPALAAVPPDVAAMIARGRAELLSLPQPDGRTTKALLLPPPSPTARVAVLLHGNGETMFDRLEVAEALASRGFGIALVEYRGYGLTHGPPPSEDDIYADVEAVLGELARRNVGPERVAIWGTSLGTGPAVEMARRGRAAALVLVTPFTSIVDMGRRLAPILPARLLLAHRFDSLEKAADVACPTLVVHGDADEIIPFDMGEALARAIPGARFVRVRGGHHNDLFWGPRDGQPSAGELLDTVATHLAPR